MTERTPRSAWQKKIDELDEKFSYRLGIVERISLDRSARHGAGREPQTFTGYRPMHFASGLRYRGTLRRLLQLRPTLTKVGGAGRYTGKERRHLRVHGQRLIHHIAKHLPEHRAFGVNIRQLGRLTGAGVEIFEG